MNVLKYVITCFRDFATPLRRDASDLRDLLAAWRCDAATPDSSEVRPTRRSRWSCEDGTANGARARSFRLRCTDSSWGRGDLQQSNGRWERRAPFDDARFLEVRWSGRFRRWERVCSKKKIRDWSSMKSEPLLRGCCRVKLPRSLEASLAIKKVIITLVLNFNMQTTPYWT
jgi:hypothetical protein